MSFFILVVLLGGLGETEAMSVTGVLGEEIKIQCSHINAFSNFKYFCKGVCKNEDVLISSRWKKDSNDKYGIVDEGNTFSVTISHLTEDDPGTYWCGIERIGFDTYKKVVLTVIVGNIKDPDSDLPQSNSNEATINTNASSSKKLVYIGAGLGVVGLALAMVLLIFFKHRNRDISTSSGKDNDMVYATPSSQKHGARTANEDQAIDGRTNNIRSASRDHADNIYSNVTISSEPQTQPESPFYCTVTFNKHTGCSTVTPRAEAVTYTTVKHISTDESTVYCNV